MWYWKHINIHVLSLVNFPTSVHTDAEAPPRFGKASLSDHEHVCATCSSVQGFPKATVKRQWT